MEENEVKTSAPEDFAAVAAPDLATVTAEMLNCYHDVLRRLGNAE